MRKEAETAKGKFHSQGKTLVVRGGKKGKFMKRKGTTVRR